MVFFFYYYFSLSFDKYFHYDIPIPSYIYVVVFPLSVWLFSQNSSQISFTSGSVTVSLFFYM